MNKNSLFFKITLFFGILIVITHIIIYLGYNLTKQQQIDLYVTKYLKSFHQIQKAFHPQDMPPPPQEDFHHKKDFHPMPPPKPKKIDLKKFDELLKQYDLEIAKISYHELQNNGTLIANDREWEFYEYKGYKYFYLNDRFQDIIIKDTITIIDTTKYIIALTILLNICFLTFYIFLIKKLQPLKVLKENITKFANGDLEINTLCNGKDEISEVSNEFNNAIEKIRTLTKSRNLFLRNIMHELKTPITKGLLISNLLEKNKFQESLKKAFFRLEYLLNEFAKIEQFTSSNIKLTKNTFSLEDIIDNSLDILFINKEELTIELQENLLVEVDFELFTIVIKNLLDNAMKYGNTKPKLLVQNKSLSIISEGEKLPYPIEEYQKPFNRKYENSSAGLGLGLYIIHSILKAHNLALEYKFTENNNIFTINF
jgi:two-component system OmpR family sensor kinase